MSLLALEHVSKRAGRGRASRALLRDVSLDVEPSQFVSIWCLDSLERTTLARIAAGIERPDDGVVKLEGVELQHALAEQRRGRLRFVEPYSAAADGNTVLSYVKMPLLARGATPRHAAARAAASLARAGVSPLADLCVEDLDATELVRVAVAEALASEPRIIVLDDPTCQVDRLARGSIVSLLRSIADEGVAVLTTTSEAIGVAGVDRVLTLRGGKLRADVSAPVAEVIPLPARTVRS
jgi:putative ABC transport system ATP-binding protein